jgi:hypothetical protein
MKAEVFEYLSEVHTGQFVAQSLAESLKVHELAIEEEAAKIRSRIEQVDRGFNTVNQVHVFSDKNDPAGWFEIHGAMTKIFEEYGVLDAYYHPDMHPELIASPYTESEDGWKLSLKRADGKGLFEIDYKAFVFTKSSTSPITTIAPLNRQTITYRRS